MVLMVTKALPQTLAAAAQTYQYNMVQITLMDILTKPKQMVL